jgi:prepilin-type N-terminal cleavage/methylation domain-containing protein
VRSHAGYSLIELVVVLGIVAVLAVMAGLQIVQAKPSLDGDGAMRVVLGQIRASRELAITERRNMRITFIGDSVVRVIREEVPGPQTTTLSTTGVERGVTFTLVNGLPDTPDAFGRTKAIDFGSATFARFTPDGTLTDQDGNTINGTIFMAQPGSTRSARAITVLGSTGRIRAYKWDGRAWKLE